AVVDDRLRPELPEQPLHDLVLADVVLGHPDLEPGDVLPRRRPLGEGAEDRREGVGSLLRVRPPPEVVVDGVDLVAPLREVHRRRPPEVAVPSEDQDAHAGRSFPAGVEVPGTGPGPAYCNDPAVRGPNAQRGILVLPGADSLTGDRPAGSLTRTGVRACAGPSSPVPRPGDPVAET